jgi:hypothetical protein
MNAVKLIAAGVLALAGTFGVASAQDMPEGRVYAFHSRAQKGCPTLDWHVVVGANGALSGMVSWDNMRAMAHATGTVDMQARTFQMTATEVGGQHRTATVTGTVRQDGWLVAEIKGPKLDCKGVTVPWFTPPPPR